MDARTGVSTVVVHLSRSQPETWVLPVFVILVLVCALTLAAPNLLSIGFVFERNYNEGWDSDYWRINNYPILVLAESE
jgi:hypothetical protein